MDIDEAPLPHVTRETLAYAMHLSVWSACFKADADVFKGRDESFYEKALKDLQDLSGEQCCRSKFAAASGAYAS